jgi:K+ transporter
MGGAALVLMVLTKGSVKFMVVLYSINVFVTFCLSQAGMVGHWWKTHESGWKHKLLINGSGLALCVFILLSVVTLKFFEGGWITLLITGILAATAISIKKHYNNTHKQLQRLDRQMKIERFLPGEGESAEPCEYDPQSKTAVLLVNGFNGLGLHSLLNIIRLFGKEFRNFVFVQVGIIDAGTFKGTEEMDHLRQKTTADIQRYVQYMNSQGFYAKGFSFVGLDIIEEMEKQTPGILKHYPNAVFFGGQLVFPSESRMNRWLHNYTVFALQRMFYRRGIPFVILPIRLPQH